MGGPPLEFINIQPKKGGSASRIHQPKGGPPLESINQRGGPPLEFINHQPKNGGPPLGTISMDLAVPCGILTNFFDFFTVHTLLATKVTGIRFFSSMNPWYLELPGEKLTINLITLFEIDAVLPKFKELCNVSSQIQIYLRIDHMNWM